MSTIERSALSAHKQKALGGDAERSRDPLRAAQNLKPTPWAVTVGRKAVLARVGSQFSQRL